jgi:hypothetical protein
MNVLTPLNKLLEFERKLNDKIQWKWLNISNNGISTYNSLKNSLAHY